MRNIHLIEMLTEMEKFDSEEPLMLTAVETAELDAYMALVSLFESEQKRKRSKKRKRKQSTSTRKTQEKNQ